MSSRLVGRVHFNATLDGKSIPGDAQRAGRQAGLAGGKAFGEQWDKEFRNTLTQQGRAQLAHWQRRGSADGLAYGRGLEVEFGKFTNRLSRAFDNFQGLNISSSFMDDWVQRSGDMEGSVSRLREDLELLQRQGGITDAQFRTSNGIIDEWSRKIRTVSDDVRTLIDTEGDHTRSAGSWNREWKNSSRIADELNDQLVKLLNTQNGMGLSWGSMSHNARQWTLIIGAITAALPELAGLSSAAGAGLLTLGSAATSGVIGIGATVSAIVGLNQDLETLPASLRSARSGLEDFKGSFSDLNAVITDRAFADSEQAWRSLGATVRGLSPAFGVVGDEVGSLLDDLSAGIAPGTRNFERLNTIVTESAEDFGSLARVAGTFGEGLLAAFSNPEMQRSVDELIGWLDELATGFTDFTEGGTFDDWMRHGRSVLGEFGDLLNTTGGLLNDLVTPESIGRLNTFMENIGTFLDTGGRGILEFADELNAFGLISQVLADIGVALEPIREPVADLAEEFARLAGGGIDGVAMSLGALASATAPVIGGMADLLGAIPTEALEVLGGVALGTAAAFVVLKGAQGIQGALLAMQGISLNSDKAVTKLGRLANAASLVGAGVVGITALNQASQDFFGNLRGYDSTLNNVIGSSRSLSSVWDDLGGSALGTKFDMDVMSDALDQVHQIGGDLDQFFPSLGALFTDAGRQAGGLAEVLSTLSPELANLAGSDVQAATKQFAGWADELGATDQQVLNMLAKMPEFRDVLEAVSLQANGTATDQDILNLALGRGTSATDTNRAALQGLQGQAQLTEAQVQSLADTIRGFGDESLSAREAERQFQASLDELTNSVTNNGASLDISTEKGRANQAALDEIARASMEAAAAKLELTGNEDDAAAAIQRGRDALIDQLGQFGIVDDAAAAYADELGLIPDDILTELILSGVSASQTAIDNFISRNDGRTLTVYQRMVQGALVGGATGAGAPRTAIGGMFDGAQVRMIAEEGPEAVVPLNRPLSMVDPDVRWLSAIAQGKMDKIGGGFGSQSVKNIEAGAIVVQATPNPIATATEVLDGIARDS